MNILDSPRVFVYDMLKHIKEGNMEYDVEFYELPNGTFPAYEFIEAQPLKMKTKIYKTIGLLEDFGSKLRKPYSESLGDGILELRTQIGSDITRVLYFFIAGQKAILTHGFIKKTEKTPPEEKERAKKYRKDYIAQHKGEFE